MTGELHSTGRNSEIFFTELFRLDQLNRLPETYATTTTGTVCKPQVGGGTNPKSMGMRGHPVLFRLFLFLHSFAHRSEAKRLSFDPCRIYTLMRRWMLRACVCYTAESDADCGVRSLRGGNRRQRSVLDKTGKNSDDSGFWMPQSDFFVEAK